MKPHPKEPDGVVPYVEEVVALGSPLFDGFDADAICTLMKISQPENDPCRKAERQFMALLLNIASKRLTSCQGLVSDGTVQEAIDAIKGFLSVGQCKEAQQIAAEINEGNALIPCDSSLLISVDQSFRRSEENSLTQKQELTFFSQISPNPTRKEVFIAFDVPGIGTDGSASLLESPLSQEVSLVIYNLAGQNMRTLVNEEKESGTYRVIWKGLDEAGVQVPSGIYLIRLSIGHNSQTRKVTLLH